MNVRSAFLVVCILCLSLFVAYSLFKRSLIIQSRNVSFVSTNSIDWSLEVYSGVSDMKYTNTRNTLPTLNQQPETEYDVTLVTQGSLNRWGFMCQIAEYWKGPMSIVFYLSDDEVLSLHAFRINTTLRSNIHIDYYVKTNSSVYPNNALRNKAIDNVLTSHFYISDMDIWPSPSTYEAIRNLPRSILSDDKLAIIIPAYEIKLIPCSTFDQCISFYRTYYPKTKDRLRNCLTSKQCHTFRPGEWLHDYYPENWFYASGPLISVPCWKSDTQEPYVMVKKGPTTPRFNESFINYGYNKVQWLEHLRHVGYRFEVLLDGYSVDIPHPPSPFRNDFLDQIRKTKIFPMLDLYNDFKNYLNATVKNEAVMLLCPKARIQPRRIYFTSDIIKLKKKNRTKSK